MSASNWTVCPKCLKREKKKYDELKAEVELSYGAISLEEFKELENELEGHNMSMPQTLREDYEFIMDEYGVLYITYKASCNVCKVEYKYKKSVDLNEDK